LVQIQLGKKNFPLFWREGGSVFRGFAAEEVSEALPPKGDFKKPIDKNGQIL
jgi:hypothetical protein